MSVDAEKPEDSDSSVELRWAPRISVSFDDSYNLSYVDLLESYYSSKDLEFPSETSSDSAEHHYPLLLQSINERLEKYGQLAIVKDVAMRSKAPERKLSVQAPEDPNNPKKRKKTLYMEADENFYDLSDRFIDDRGLNEDVFSEKEFEQAISDGFYMIDAKDLKKKPKKNKPKSKKEGNEGIPKPAQKCLTRLRKLYDNKTSNTANYFPKGVQEILKSLRFMMEKDKTCNQALIWQRVAIITGKSERDIVKFTENKLLQAAARKKLADLKKDFDGLRKSISKAKTLQKVEVTKLIKDYLIKVRDYTDEQQETAKKRARVRNFRAELVAITEEVKDLNPEVFQADEIEAISLEDDVRGDLWPNGFEPILSNEYDVVEYKEEDFNFTS
mmetsp:Transcript_27645/g.49914  ORF Transcript_27645/g.49914 Transcript_27645/m.49914 type:complete len:386 (-) Transcript_27645:1802-2959(-)